MDMQESSRKFKEADTLFRQGQFQASMLILNELNQTYPGDKNILIPLALCLERLGRFEDAYRLGQQINAHFQDARAQALCARLSSQIKTQPQMAAPPAGIIPQVPDMFDTPVRRAPTPKPAPARDWKPFLIVGGIILVVLLAGIPIVKGISNGGFSAANQVAEAPQDGQPPSPVAPIGLLMGSPMITIGFIFLGYLINVAVTYFVLKIMGKLRHNDLSADFGDVAVTCLFVDLVAWIPLIGWIIALIIIAKHFELSCGELLIYVIASLVVGLIAMFIIMLLLAGLVATSSVAAT